jgi:hypothetical protein
LYVYISVLLPGVSVRLAGAATNRTSTVFAALERFTNLGGLAGPPLVTTAFAVDAAFCFTGAACSGFRSEIEVGPWWCCAGNDSGSSTAAVTSPIAAQCPIARADVVKVAVNCIQNDMRSPDAV